MASSTPTGRRFSLPGIVTGGLCRFYRISKAEALSEDAQREWIRRILVEAIEEWNLGDAGEATTTERRPAAACSAHPASEIIVGTATVDEAGTLAGACHVVKA